MDGFISLVFFAVIIFLIIRRMKSLSQAESERINKRQNSQKAALNRSKPQQYGGYKGTGAPSAKSSAKNYKMDTVYPEKMKDGVKTSAKGGTTISDDRRNDWLAKQMRDEKAALYRMGYMFGFKPGTSTISAAAENRSAHAHDCDSEGIDTAAGR